jgi:peptide/nickel transport system substrate-binding protein
MWKPLPGFFTPGTPLYNEEGGDILKSPRNIDAAKKLLAQSGYAGQPITCLVAANSNRKVPPFRRDLLFARLGFDAGMSAAPAVRAISSETHKPLDAPAR